MRAFGARLLEIGITLQLMAQLMATPAAVAAPNGVAANGIGPNGTGPNGTGLAGLAASGLSINQTVTDPTGQNQPLPLHPAPMPGEPQPAVPGVAATPQGGSVPLGVSPGIPSGAPPLAEPIAPDQGTDAAIRTTGRAAAARGNSQTIPRLGFVRGWHGQDPDPDVARREYLRRRS